MFSKLLVASALAGLVVTTGTPPPASQCSTGPVQCCNQVQSSSEPGVSTLLGLLGIVLGGADVPIGFNCFSIPIVGAGSGAKCSAQAVCCSDNNYNGVVVVGCTPVNINL